MADWLDNRHGAVELLLTSANLWAGGYKLDLNESIGTLTGLGEDELFAIKELVEKGFTMSADNPYLGKGRRYGRSFINRTGLKTGRRQGQFGLMVKSESMFAPYREAMESMLTADVRRAEERRADRAANPATDLSTLAPNGMDPVDWARAKRIGGDTGVYVPAEGKVARNWKRKTENGEATPLPDFTKSDSAAEVAGEGMVIIDWDADHDGTGDPHGLNHMECDLGAVIGSDDFPMPYLERSARGGYHGAYRVPSDLMPFFKKSAVGKATSGDPTLLVDLKAAGGGYVICAGSRTDQGAYEPVSAPRRRQGADADPADAGAVLRVRLHPSAGGVHGARRQAPCGPRRRAPHRRAERVRAVQVIRRPPASGHIAHGAPHAPQRAGAPRQVRGGREPGHGSAGVGGDGGVRHPARPGRRP